MNNLFQLIKRSALLYVCKILSMITCAISWTTQLNRFTLASLHFLSVKRKIGGERFMHNGSMFIVLGDKAQRAYDKRKILSLRL